MSRTKSSQLILLCLLSGSCMYASDHDEVQAFQDDLARQREAAQAESARASARRDEEARRQPRPAAEREEVIPETESHVPPRPVGDDPLPVDDRTVEQKIDDSVQRDTETYPINLDKAEHGDLIACYDAALVELRYEMEPKALNRLRGLADAGDEAAMKKLIELEKTTEYRSSSLVALEAAAMASPATSAVAAPATANPAPDAVPSAPATAAAPHEAAEPMW